MIKRKPRQKNFKTFTKKWVSFLMYVSVFDLQLSYVLAFLGRGEIAEDLSKVIAVEIIGVMLGYFCKSFFETKEEEKTRLEEKKIEAGREGDALG